MPEINHIIGLKNFRLLNVDRRGSVFLYAHYEAKAVCPHCQSDQLRKKDSFDRKLKHCSVGTSCSVLIVRAHKFLCKSCGRYFNSRFEAIVPYSRATPLLKDEVFQKHMSGISQAALSSQLNLGPATIERWFHKRIELNVRKLKNRHCPKIMGIDEHFFTRKSGYATTIADLSKHKIFDVVLGRSEKSLEGYLKHLPGKKNVKVVLMDLSTTYRSIIKKHFPNALIVADRFHVVRLVNHVFLQCWKRFDPAGRFNRGLLSLMRRHQWNLSLEQNKNLQSYLAKHPSLLAIYEFKQRLNQLMNEKHHTQKSVRPLIFEFLKMIEDLCQSPVEELVTLGKTLGAWAEPIARMWRFTKTNSITEGLHNKMELISRRAYGFKNFQNYRIRVLILCGYSL